MDTQRNQITWLSGKKHDVKQRTLEKIESILTHEPVSSIVDLEEEQSIQINRFAEARPDGSIKFLEADSRIGYEQVQAAMHDFEGLRKFKHFARFIRANTISSVTETTQGRGDYSRIELVEKKDL